MSRIRTQRVFRWWSAAQAALRCDLSVGMVRYLAREEILTPSQRREAAKPRSQHLRYSYNDLVILRAIARLLEQGVEVRRLKKDLALVHQRYVKEARRKPDLRYLVTDGRNAMLLEPGQALERLDSGQRAFQFMLNIDSLKQDVGSEERRVAGARRITSASLKKNRPKGIPKGASRRLS
ncbi:MerR family transcriptional regulator [Reyranella sp.]|uniref:MerR family transcriptional regulator n=1 Tax=Reyranella sp. TaxID=1929291 RepID=UPI003523EBCC